jgi:uncharacterized protein (DUF58 family)
VRSLGVELASTFPFGLFRGSLRLEVQVDLLVLPRLGSVRRLVEPARGGGGACLGGLRSRGSDEFFGLHDWREGESLRHVHWKLSARRGRLLLRDLRSRDEPPVQLWLVLDLPGARPSGRPHPSFEKAVSLTATLGEHFLRAGRTVVLGLAGGTSLSRRRLRGRAGLLPMLAVLAEVAPCDGEPASRAAECVAASEREGDTCLVVLAGGPARAPRHDWALGRGPLEINVDAEGIGRLFDRRLRPTQLFAAGSFG